jgi:predicted O-linked N-acetylglucosamine transferase (SPINDLY family)
VGARVQQLTIVELFAQAEQLERLQEPQKVVELYKSWIALNPTSPVLHAVYFNYGVVLSRAGDKAGAINAFRDGIRLKPDFYPPYINLGRVLEDSGQLGPAVGQWMALVNHLPAVAGENVRHKLMALQQLGRVLEGAYQDGPAEDALKQSLDISVTQPEVIQHWVSLRQRQCKWPAIQGWEGVDTKALMKEISPLSLAIHTDDPMFGLARAYRYAKEYVGVPPAPPQQPHVARVPRGGRKLRIGYLSSDLREHAVGFGLTDVMETHDRTKFEIYAYYCGIKRTDPTQQRIQRSVDRWIDINGLSDKDAARRMSEDQIDILVDLNGYTRDARTRVIALRPAPIIVNWFGFPGTMGSPYHNYLLADPYIIPEGHEIYYTEKVMRLPCYQPNDRKRPISSHRPSRAEEGLPADGIVYCCLNGMQKITPPVFAAWLKILNAVPNSVLWLLSGTADTNARLQQMAQQHGIAPNRLVFAQKKLNPDHLARYPLADVFLDTFPYGAHTTAADALGMGVPILTIAGRSFASRVCGSVVRAAGMEDLICPTLDAYVWKAIEFGTVPGPLSAAKLRLAANRDTCLLFDTPKLTRHLEEAFAAMWREFEAGALPVPDLKNLDVYAEIALDLALEDVGALPDEAYVRRYKEKLQAWNQTYPLQADTRFWQDPRAQLRVIENSRETGSDLAVVA